MVERKTKDHIWRIQIFRDLSVVENDSIVELEVETEAYQKHVNYLENHIRALPYG